MRFLFLAVLAVSCSKVEVPAQRHGRSFSPERQALVSEALSQPITSYVRKAGDIMSGALGVKAGGGSGLRNAAIFALEGPANSSTYGLWVDRVATPTRGICLAGNNTTGVCLNGITVDGTTAATFSSSINTASGYVSSQTSPGNAFAATSNGGRFDFGAGANDYASSDGTTVTFAGPVTVTGTLINTALVGTPASGTGITAVYSGEVRHWVHKITVINTALAAAGTSDVTLHTTPVNSRIIRVTADVTQVFTGGALSAMTVMCGNSAGGNQYLLAGSVFAAQTTLGDVAAEVGAGLLTATWADFGTPAAGVPGALTVQCRFTCTGANCSAATQGSVSFYVEGMTY